MRTFIFVLLALSACSTLAYDIELLGEQDWNKYLQDDSIKPEEYGLILNAEGKKLVKRVIEHMPCGWPEQGIPPLAPYTNADLQIHLAKSVVDSLLQFIRFRIDGLNDIDIVKLKVSYTFSKTVQFHIIFKDITATSPDFNSDTFIDLMQELGLTVRYEGAGPMKFSLKNLSVSGRFKYKMPFIFGSIKIYKFTCTVTLGAVNANIGGILGNGPLNQLINDEIETLIPAFINGNQRLVSDHIEQVLVPRVNAKLKGRKVWSLLGKVLSSDKPCIPPPAPWSTEL